MYGIYGYQNGHLIRHDKVVEWIQLVSGSPCRKRALSLDERQHGVETSRF